MIKIKTFNDIEDHRGKISDTILDHIKNRIGQLIDNYKDIGYEYEPDKYGYYVLIEKEDNVRDLKSIGLDFIDNNLIKVIKEYADYHQMDDIRFFDVLVLFTDECGMLFIIPDEDWLEKELKENLISTEG